MSSLTPRQQEILAYIRVHARFVYPTVRQISKHFRLRPSTVQRHIDALHRKNVLLRKIT